MSDVMKKLWIISGTVIAGFVLLVTLGCSVFVNDRALDLQDVISMSQLDVGTEVIIRHIEVTHSKFKLRLEDVIRLKQEGVDDRVILCMLETEVIPEKFGYEDHPAPYEIGYQYYGIYFPVYSSCELSGQYEPEAPYLRRYQSMSLRDRGLVGRFYREYPLSSSQSTGDSSSGNQTTGNKRREPAERNE